MRIELNGQLRRFDGVRTVSDLLRLMDLQPLRVAVELNEELVTRKAFTETVLHDGDRLEVVTFVGGG